jgi:basic amino acid/polyamine antiporter, APA family
MSNFKREIRLYDAVMLVSGSMIGSGIFIVSSDVARQTGASGWMLVSWLIAGLLTMAGALCYGELSAMFPQAGGQYVFLQKAYNRLVGFLYGWSFFAVIQTGTIAAIAVAFSTYTGVVLPEIINDNAIGDLKVGTFYLSSQRLLAILSIILLTYSNTKGIKQGKIIQNIFSSTKLIALGLIILIGFTFFNRDVFSFNFDNAFDLHPFQFTKFKDNWIPNSITPFGIILALGVTQVGTLFASDAWNTLTFTGDEVVEPQKTIPRGLAIGTLLVTVLFILTNIVYLGILPLKGDPNATDAMERGIQFASQDRVAAAAAEVIGGPPFAIVVAILIMISTFGCNNGLILSGARVYYTMAKDSLFFKNFGVINDKGVPQNALWWQCLWASLLCLSGKYGDLLDYLMGVVIMFYALTIFGIFILRRTMPDTARPVKAPLYPIVPAIYVILTVAIVMILIKEKPEYTFPGLIVVAIGIPVYYFFNKK